MSGPRNMSRETSALLSPPHALALCLLTVGMALSVVEARLHLAENPKYNILQREANEEWDLYRALGARRLAQEPELRSAMRRYARINHPGRCRDACQEDMVEAFYRRQQAYMLFRDRSKRRKYEIGGDTEVQKHTGPKFEDPLRDPFELRLNSERLDFRMHFGFREGEERKTPNMGTQFPVTLEMVNTGANLTIFIERNVLCPVCNGTGAATPADLRTCPLCHGEKSVTDEHSFSNAITQAVVHKCHVCDGFGSIARHQCSHCGGQRVVPEKTEKKFTLEPGTPDGYQYTFKGEAEQVPDAIAGDVIIQVTNEEHPVFERDEANLLWSTNITLMEALIGFNRSVRSLDGRLIEFEKRNVTKPGDVFLVAEEGLPVFGNANKRGDLVVSFNIQFPDKVDEKRRKALRKKRQDTAARRKAASENGSSSGDGSCGVGAEWDSEKEQCVVVDEDEQSSNDDDEAEDEADDEEDEADDDGADDDKSEDSASETQQAGQEDSEK